MHQEVRISSILYSANWHFVLDFVTSHSGLAATSFTLPGKTITRSFQECGCWCDWQRTFHGNHSVSLSGCRDHQNGKKRRALTKPVQALALWWWHFRPFRKVLVLFYKLKYCIKMWLVWSFRQLVFLYSYSYHIKESFSTESMNQMLTCGSCLSSGSVRLFGTLLEAWLDYLSEKLEGENCISQSFHHSQLDLVQGRLEASII